MIEDTDALFADEPVIEPAEIATEEVQPVEEPAAAEPEVAEVAEVEPLAQPERPDPGYVPIAAMMDERDRRKAAEARLAQFEQQQPNTAPNPYDDPEGFAAHSQSLVHQAIINDRFERSNEDAVEKFGEETVLTAIKWAQGRAQANPAFAAEYMSKPRPIHWIVQQHKRDELVGQIGDRSMDDFVRDYLVKNPDKFGLAPVAATDALPVAQPKQALTPAKVPPRSLATQGSGPSDVRDVATGPLAGVDAVFPQ